MSSPAQISESVCVSAVSGHHASALVAARSADPTVARARAALLAGRPIPPLDPASLVAYVPPADTRSRFDVRASGAVDPADPTHGWVSVEAVTPFGRAEVPLALTVMLDTSASMDSAPLAALPVLQDGRPATPVSRIDLAKRALQSLVARLPSQSTVAIGVFEAGRAAAVLGPTPPSDRAAIDQALERATVELARAGHRTPVEVGYGLSSAVTDGCADRRILLVTDDDARLDVEPDRAADVIAGWRSRGIGLWTLSLGTLGAAAPRVASLTAGADGVLITADTLSEAVEPLGAMRATGAAVRDAAVEVSFGPGVTGWQRVGASPGAGPSDRWVLPSPLDAGWRTVALYELTIDPTVSGPLATVDWRGSSPVPGDWTVGGAVGDAIVVSPTPLPAADAPLRHRVFAVALARAVASPAAIGPAREASELVHPGEVGPASELVGWLGLLPVPGSNTPGSNLPGSNSGARLTAP